MPKLSRATREWILVLSVAIGTALLLRTVVVQQYYVSGPSMEPTMVQNDRLVVGKFAYWFSDVRRGHVVVFDRVTSDGERERHDDLVKRVIAVGGDSVRIAECVVLVNDVAIVEPYLTGEGRDVCGLPDMDPVELEADELFVMGDNRSQSFDSRMFGAIPRSWVVGRAYAIVWPLSHATGL
jgi:signal peptidase I